MAYVFCWRVQPWNGRGRHCSLPTQYLSKVPDQEDLWLPEPPVQDLWQDIIVPLLV